MGDELRAATPRNVTPLDILPAPVKKIRELARAHFTTVLANLFDSTDDALFEMADRSGSDSAQAMFFSAMRELRMQRKTIEKSFIESINDAFNSLIGPKKTPLASAGDGGLSLIEDTELEESVAVSNMVAKISSNYGSVLNQITRRIDSLINNRTITEISNPVGGEVVCEAFKNACKTLKLDIRAKLVIYKIFDKTVIGELEGIYFELNKKLFEMGVLPDLKSNLIKRSTSARRTSNSSTDAASPQSDQEVIAQAQEAFYALQTLLIQSKSERSPAANLLPVTENGPSLSRSDLVQLFSTIQEQHPEASNLAESQTEKLDIYRALHNVLQSSPVSHPHALGKAEDDTINLISMLFEFILDDRQLSSPMKAILARLQIPMLKVALLDKTFFSRGGHPARKLLNELAASALGWSEPREIDKDPLYQRIKNVVKTILNDFVDDVTIFDRLLEDFSTFDNKEKRRAQLIEQRTRDAEEGLAVSKHARSFVGSTLNKIVAGKNLPKVAIDLLCDGWNNYMFLLHVRQGPDSDAWSEAVKTAEELTWSVQAKADISDRQQLLKHIPDLLKKLRNGLNSISYGDSKIREQFISLENIHLRCLRGEVITPDDEINSDTLQIGTDQKTTYEGDRTSPSTDTDTDTEESDDQDHTKPADEIIVKSPVLFKDIEAQNDAETEPGSELELPLKALENIGVGSWVEFKHEEERPMRAKLAAILKASGNYIFVNRVGIKIAEETPNSLARLIHEDKLEILDRSMVFDRALESVIGHLREMKN